MTIKTVTLCLALSSLIGLLAVPSAQAGGALVSSPVKGKYYFMTHRPSGAYAAQLAMADCAGHHGGGCRVLVAYERGCVAIAHGAGHSGWAVKSSDGAARADAMGKCQRYGVACHIDVDKCD